MYYILLKRESNFNEAPLIDGNKRTEAGEL